jgi:hypothetical protein
MRNLARLIRSRLDDEQGVILQIVLALLAVGTVLVFPFLDFARLRFGDVTRSLLETEAYYAADAGVEAVLAHLREGTDPLDGGYSPPVFSLNGFDVSVSVASPPRDAYVPFGSVFVDPESGTSLNPLPGNTDLLYVLENVKPFADFQISWVFTPVDSGWQLTVFEGVGTGGSQLANATKNESPARLLVKANTIKGGTYTIRFRNKSPSPITAAPFSPAGEPDSTWVRVTAWKDYVITSTAGGTTLQVYARQGPGPNQVVSTVTVSTWNGAN